MERTWRRLGRAPETVTGIQMAAFCRKPLRRRRKRRQARRCNRIPNSAGATGRVARPVKYGGDNGKPWRGALFHRARRTMLGDDGNQIGAYSALRTLHSALERLFSGIHFGMDDWGNWRLNFHMATEPIRMLKSNCSECFGGIEFSENGFGHWVSCPHCGQKTKLESDSPWPPSLLLRPQRSLT